MRNIQEELTQPAEDDYATLPRVARYLECGWSDVLLPTVECDSSSITDPVSPQFYKDVADEIVSWIQSLGVQLESFADVGSATGRLIFEIEQRFPKMQRLVAVDSSACLCAWLSQLLNGGNEINQIPVIAGAGEVRYSMPKSLPAPIRESQQRLEVVAANIDEVADQLTGFQLVCCLNVLDRHPSPRSLMNALDKMLAPGGVLVLASPLDYDTSALAREDQVGNLNELFAANAWSKLGENNFKYPVRYHERAITTFISQTVAMLKLTT